MELPQLEERLRSIESRLSTIERNLHLTAPAKVIPPPAAPSSRPTLPPLVASEPKPGNWLGIIAAICFILAAGFIIKLSIDSGWLTPVRQIGLAALLGISLVGAGLAMLRADREYASLLPGTGIIVLYLTAFAAYNYYALISFEAALAATSLVSCLCIFLYTEIRHDIYAITAAAGAYLAPSLLELHVAVEFSLYYYLICSLAFATISVWVQTRTLTMVSAYLAIFMTALAGGNLWRNDMVASLLALHFFIFTLGIFFYTRHTHTPLTENEAWNFFPVLLVFYALEYHFINLVHPGLAPWISLGFAGALIGLYLSAKRWFPAQRLGSESMVLAFATLACFHSAYLELLPDDFRPWLFVAIMLGIAVFPRLLSKPRHGSLLIPSLALFAILAIEYARIVFHLLNAYAYNATWLLISVASFTSFWAVLVRTEGAYEEKMEYSFTLLGAAHVLAVLGLYRLTTEYGSLAVSASWLFYAVAVMVFAFTRKDELMAKSALLVLSFAAGKALLYDAASAPTVIRILCLLLTGAVLYGCGFLMRKTTSWRHA